MPLFVGQVAALLVFFAYVAQFDWSVFSHTQTADDMASIREQETVVRRNAAADIAMVGVMGQVVGSVAASGCLGGALSQSTSSSTVGALTALGAAIAVPIQHLLDPNPTKVAALAHIGGGIVPFSTSTSQCDRSALVILACKTLGFTHALICSCCAVVVALRMGL